MRHATQSGRETRTFAAGATTILVASLVATMAFFPGNTVRAAGAYPPGGSASARSGVVGNEPRLDVSAQLSAALEAPAASVVGGRKPWVPDRNVPAVPTEDSPVPTKQEWDTSAAVATEVRVTEPGCLAQRIREHYRIVCDRHAAIALTSGTRKGVTFGEFRDSVDAFRPSEVWVVFPARPGDRRFLQIFRQTKWGKALDAQISEVFLEGEAIPRITVQGRRSVL